MKTIGATPSPLALGGGDFIPDYKTYPTISDAAIVATPFSMAQLGKDLYFAFGDRGVNIAVSHNNGHNIVGSDRNDPVHMFLGREVFVGSSLAAFNGNLYVGYADAKTNINLSRATLDGSGNVTGLQWLGRAIQGTDGFPTLCASPVGAGLFMVWQGKRNPPMLNIGQFQPPSTPPADLLASTHPYPQYHVKTTPSMAVIGTTPYVAFETEDTKTIVVVFSENGQAIRGDYTSGQGYRAPSIAALGNDLFLAYYGTDRDHSLNLVQVILDGSGNPQGFSYPPRGSKQSSDVGPNLVTTSTGLVIAWHGKNDKDLSHLNVGWIR